MRKYILFSVLALCGIAVGIYFIPSDFASGAAVAVKGADNSGEEGARSLTDKSNAARQLEMLAVAIEGYQRANHDQLKQIQSSYLQTAKALKDLESRLHSLENSDSPGATAQQNENASHGPTHGRISDADVGQWLDKSLNVSEADLKSTEQTTHKIAQSLAKIPGANLDDMRCGDRFCRATFSHAAGERPAVEKLFGEPPFMNEGFTIVQPDGRVLLYFNQPGESMDELRAEVQAWSG